MKKFLSVLFVSAILFGCGGGGDGEPHSETTPDPVPTTPPPAVEGGDLPDIGVDFTPPEPEPEPELPNVGEGGDLPDIGINQELVPVLGTVVEVKHISKKAYFLGIKPLSGEDKLTWVLSYSEGVYDNANMTWTPTKTSMGFSHMFGDDVNKLVEYQIPVRVMGRVTSESQCHYVPEDGKEFCAPAIQGLVDPLFIASSAGDVQWDVAEGFVQLNQVKYKVEEFYNFETFGGMHTGVGVIKQPSGKLIAVSSPSNQGINDTVYAKMSLVDHENNLYEFLDSYGKPVPLTVDIAEHREDLWEGLRTLKEGEVAYITGSRLWGNYDTGFKIYVAVNINSSVPKE